MVNGCAIVGAEESRVAARFAHLCGYGFVVKLDAQPWRGGQWQIAILHDKGVAKIAFTKMHMLLRQEVWRGRVELQTGCQRDWPKRTVGRDGSIV